MSVNQHPIVVGIEGRPIDRAALRWALAEAASRRVAVRLVHAYPLAVESSGMAPRYAMMPELSESTLLEPAHRMVDEAVAFARAASQDSVSVHGVAVIGQVKRVLANESKRASVLVLGSHRRGPVTSTILGSVGATLAARADCPVVVVRSSNVGAPRGPVLVGVDDTPVSEFVLEAAFDYADRHGTSIRALHCWLPIPTKTVAWLRGSGTDAEQAAKDQLAERVAPWQEKYPDVPVELVVVRGPAVRHLLAESDRARLVVVGAHGRHAAFDQILGSVSQSVLTGADTAVAVIHGPR